ncbi:MULTISPECIES: phospho-sugar mutase [Microbacterium]|uniref:Phosphomannomutase n=1 Tax=Microbacterium testaceum TaxID=2033 RepID=A0A147FC55_MICTE|nr:phospho-sugar mutase [Microbacterium testaceum]KTS06493.1 phosphomannomutase [Microbacterium testaceum]KTS14154.1 phosphomannomutase [Microbacterium testaceum]KTS61012.1 phosphomannomutase [Microbacterium testaceum]
MSEYLAAARAWLAQDPDPVTREELTALITRVEDGDDAAAADLADRFSTRLAFGTAGLRGTLGAGSNRMNRVLVAQAAAGFAAYLREKQPDATPTVVVGYDGRRNSDVFARDSVEIFAGAGLHAILLPRLLPTPVLAFAVRHLGADAGVMVTASHNPPDDNGYKVYLGGADDGAQIVSPADAEIAAHIQRVADDGDVTVLPRSVGYANAPESVVEAYVAATAAVAPAPAGAEGLRWVYTAMHGVGWETVSRVLTEAGYPAPVVVEAQIQPDGRFPTVAFPNPEEPGAMDLAFETARAADAELVIANDPDADRLAVAIPDAETDGGWRRLSGNEIGLLLGWRAARAAAAAGTGGTLACSLVSSPGLQAVAEHYGLDFRSTLTGFKWISRAPGIVFGFEEALGYLVNPDVVRDKDGISAAVALLGMAAEARGEGRTVADLLREFRETFGAFASDQISVRVSDVSEIAGIMASLRAQPPSAVGEVAVSRIDDLMRGVDGLPPGDVLRIWLEDGSRLIVRPSGTEPKLKLYLDVQASSAKKANRRLAALRAGAEGLLAALR